MWERFGEVDFQKWISNHSIQDVEPVVDAAVTYLTEEKKIKRIGGVGYCFVSCLLQIEILSTGCLCAALGAADSLC